MFDNQEQGAILGERNNCVVECYLDVIGNSRSTRNSYEPDVESINRVLENWAIKEIRFCGLIHSHPAYTTKLSQADIEYGIKLCEAFELERVLMPILTIGTYDLYYYYVNKHGKVSKADLIVIE